MSKCNCKVCQRNIRLEKIFKKLTKSEVDFLSDQFEQCDCDSLDLEWIKSGLDQEYLRRMDLEQHLGITEKQFAKLQMKINEEIVMKDANVKSVLDHPDIKKYQEKMRKENRCVQCINPWYDGLCECKKFDKYDANGLKIAKLAYKLIKNGWQG